VKLYRAMKVDTDGKPLVGQRRSMLGVRPTDPNNTDPRRRFDVAATNDAETVSPGEGLSTSVDPKKLLVGAGETVFEIETIDLPPELTPNSDHSPHCLIQPSSPTTLGEYQQALEDTRDLWQPIQ
jgi:hypothetical protein